jgi:CRISPR-associated protein Cmr1
MTELKVAMETVTPLFLGGAEPRGKSELRPPSFRGAMRYWLRALLAGVLGDDVKRVKEAEAAIFGSTEEKWGGASAICIQVDHPPLKPQPFAKQRAQTIKKYGREIKQPTGRDYLYWSMAEFRRRGLPARQFIPPGTPFTLTLRVRPGVSSGEAKMQEAVAALWLLMHLGGIGARSRRTAGSLAIVKPEQFGDLAFTLKGANTQQIANELGKGVSQVRQMVREIHPAEPPDFQGGKSAFDVLHPQACKIWVLGLWPSWERAVEGIGAAFRDFRTYRPPDHDNVAKWLRGEEIPTIERAIFGLPLPFRYQKGPSGVVQGRPSPSDEAITRRASPLWLKVSKTKQGKFVGIATLFLSAFLPEGEKLYEKRDEEMERPVEPPADYSLILGFISEKFPRPEEVKYE